MRQPASTRRSIPPQDHRTEIEETGHCEYWWRCTCGEEGGPVEGDWNVIWDTTVEHERYPEAR